MATGYASQMARDCPSCGTSNPDEARFCLACATPVGDGVELRRERKYATALFADIVGSTELTEREDPEVVREIIARTFDALSAEVRQFGGTLERFMGDGMLAVFGIPATHEDDPERAVRAGLAMLERVARLGEALVAEGRPPIDIRVGIEAGDVLADLDRVAGPRDRMLTGVAVNTAARLQAAARPNRILVGPVVHAQTRAAIAYRPAGRLDLKGIAEPVPAWEVTGSVVHRGGPRPTLGLHTGLIGRRDESALLTRALRRVTAERRPALVTVIGVAGVGKSRLVEEFLTSEPTAAAIHRSEGRCAAYGNRSYSALAQAVGAACGVLNDDPPETVEAKATAAVERSFGDATLAPQVIALIGGIEPTGFRREELFEAWRRFVERMADRAPLVLVLEDVHWADDGLLDFIEHFAGRGSGPVLVLVLARPDFLERRPAWGADVPDATAVVLEPLTASETEAMLDVLLKDAPDALVQLVVERSEGNPLFIGEIVRMLIDRGVVARSGGDRWIVSGDLSQVDVPRSIHALLAARIDALPATEKATLQDAAVVGRTFWTGAVEQLSGSGRGELAAELDRLAARELVMVRQPAAFSGEQEYAFRHVLIRDVAYEALPKSERWPKHLEVARWAERRAGERRTEFSELIASHHVQALRYQQELGRPADAALLHDACTWASAAGRRALGLWQPAAAVSWFRTALDIAPAATLTQVQIASLWESYGRAAEGVEPYGTMFDALAKALALFEQAGRDPDAGRVQAWLAWAAYQSGREDEIVPLAEQALTRLEPLGDSADLAMALRILGRYQRRRGDSAVAQRNLRRAMEIAERVGDDVTRAWAMITLGPMLRSAVGMQLAERGLSIAMGTGDLPLIVQAHVDVSEGYEEVTGEYIRAEALMRAGLEVARRAGSGANVTWIEGNLSDYLVDQGRLIDALEPARHALRGAREVGERLRIGYCLDTLAYVLALRLELDEAELLVHEARDILAMHPDTWLAGWVPLVTACIERARGHDDVAMRVLVEDATELGDRAEVWGGSNLQLECVRTLALAGRSDEAVVFRDRLARIAAWSVPGQALLAWADGFLEFAPNRRLSLLREAAERFAAIGRRVELGRCLLDVAQATGTIGGDPGPTLGQRALRAGRGGRAPVPARRRRAQRAARRGARAFCVG